MALMISETRGSAAQMKIMIDQKNILIKTLKTNLIGNHNEKGSKFQNKSLPLTDWDIRMLLLFCLDFLKSGRMFSKIKFDYTPTKMKDYNWFKNNPEEVRKNHIEELRKLYKCLEENNSQGKWESIQRIKTNYLNPINPIPRLPNIKDMKIILAKHHPILKIFGILKRMSPAKFKFILHRNHKAIKYLDYMNKKLNETSGSQNFWFYEKILHTKSASFKASQFRRTFRLWYKFMSLKDVDKILKVLTKLNLDYYNFRRVNIPKPDGKLRPLGVPTPV